MFAKVLACTALTSFACAQTAIESEYKLDTTETDVTTSSITVDIQELVNGDESYTVINELFKMQLSNGMKWSGDSEEFVDMVTCIPYTKKTSQVFYCQNILIKNPKNSFDRWSWYNIWPAATTVPTFNNASSLNQQMVDYNGQAPCFIYVDKEQTGEACMTPANTFVPADSQFTAYGFTWAVDIAMSFASEDAQSSWQSMILDGLTKVQVATLYASSAYSSIEGQATYNFNPNPTPGSGASTMAFIGASAALIALAAF